MKNSRLTIFTRFALVILGVTTALGVLFIIITYLATSYYHDASTQLLNKDVAWHIAKFTSPYSKGGISRQKADSVFQNAMVLSPASEVYFLDTTGKVLYFHASEKDIKRWNTDLNDISEYINSKGNRYIKGTDPRDPGNKKIFSAALVQNNETKLGYIYVILASKSSENIMNFVLGSHILRLTIQAFVIIMILSLVFSLLYLKRTSRNFQSMITVLEKFEQGDYTAKFDMSRDDELQPVTHAFNKMATLLSSSIEKLTKSEQERKAFIAGISHDLRTPLSIARGYIETLMLKDNPAPQIQEQQQLQLVHNKILQLDKMVSQLFELSKMEAVEFMPAVEPFVLAEILQEAIDTFQNRARENNIRLQCVECNEHVWIKADIAMIERVFQNLIDNAIKNTNRNGFINISIVTEHDTVNFVIENTGAPISEYLLQWVNSAGIAQEPSGRGGNAGLGLLIVQKILQLHHSALKVKIEHGKNVFSFSFPVYRS